MILGGDLGGTKTLLALAERDGDSIRIVRQQRYASNDYASFDDLLGEFLDGAPAIAAACFGVAGPTDGRDASLTYLPWRLAGADLERRFGMSAIRRSLELVGGSRMRALGIAVIVTVMGPGRRSVSPPERTMPNAD